MGSTLTIDKHLTNLDQWFQINHRLQFDDSSKQQNQFQKFNQDIQSHLSLWKIFQNHSNNNKNQFQIIPVQIEHQNLKNLFNKNQCYILLAIKNVRNQRNPQANDSHNQIDKNNNLFNLKISNQFVQCLENLKINMQKNTFQTAVKKTIIQCFQLRIYSILGKKAKSKAKLMTASYCLKLSDFLNSKHKINILSNGGVLRNKKLQKGSILSILNEIQSRQQKNWKKISDMQSEFKQIDIFNFLTNFWTNQHDKKGLTILNYKSQVPLPLIQTQINNKNNINNSNHFNSNNNQKIQKLNLPDTTKSKKPVIQKMNLKLDFSKPLNLNNNSKPFINSHNQAINSNKPSSLQMQTIQLTNRSEQRRGKREKCQEQCSQIIQGLYVSGQKVAKNLQVLQKHKIKGIINCAGDYCLNWFENQVTHEGQPKLKYLTFFLKDSQTQNIECLFYRVIDFIQKFHKQKQNVLIHCIQGISRSITFIIAYIIFKYGYDYKKAQTFVKQKRSIACPNNGFMVQLIQFHKRLYDQYQSLISPRVFLVSSHSKQTPHILTARLLKSSLFEFQQNKKYIGLDSRGIYIIHSVDTIYIWVGSKCEQKKLQEYWNYANQFIKKLQKYQRAPVKVKAVSQGSQQKEFLQLWTLKQSPKLFENPQYNRLFVIDNEIGAKPGQQRQMYEQIQEQEDDHQKQISKLFIYPDYKTGLGIFSYDDLTGMCILVRINQSNKQKVKSKKIYLHVWKQENFQYQNGFSDQDFLQKVVDKNFQELQQENIQIFQQNSRKPSQIFKQCFLN